MPMPMLLAASCRFFAHRYDRYEEQHECRKFVRRAREQQGGTAAVSLVKSISLDTQCAMTLGEV